MAFVKKIKTRFWSQENVQNRNVAKRLNELSSEGSEIFAVNQSMSVGGTYEIIYYMDKSIESLLPVQPLPPVTNNGVEVAVGKR